MRDGHGVSPGPAAVAAPWPTLVVGCLTGTGVCGLVGDSGSVLRFGICDAFGAIFFLVRRIAASLRGPIVLAFG